MFTYLLRGISLLLFVVFISANTVSAADKQYESCRNLPSFTNLDCKNKNDVKKALDELHSCMKSRFTYVEKIYSAAWPMIEVPESGPISGGDGEWSIGCVEAWPCKDDRLAFIQKTGELPHLVMVSKTFVVDYQLDKVYDQAELKDYKILKVSGLKPDQPWFKVEFE